jgi:hypothetical protein
MLAPALLRLTLHFVPVRYNIGDSLVHKLKGIKRSSLEVLCDTPAASMCAAAVVQVRRFFARKQQASASVCCERRRQANWQRFTLEYLLAEKLPSKTRQANSSHTLICEIPATFRGPLAISRRPPREGPTWVSSTASAASSRESSRLVLVSSPSPPCDRARGSPSRPSRASCQCLEP